MPAQKTHNGWRNNWNIGGAYPINNGDPQCDDPDFDEDEAQDAIDQARENYFDYFANRC